MVSGAGGVAGVPGGDEDAVIAGGGSGSSVRSRSLSPTELGSVARS